MDIMNAHFPSGIKYSIYAVLKNQLTKLKHKYFLLTNNAQCFLKTKNNKKSLMSQIPLTALTSGIFFLLHTLSTKVHVHTIQNLHSTSSYIPGQITLKGIFLGPLFHNHTYHLLGDQLSYLLFSGAIEYLFGSSFAFLILASGLWLSNPLTQIIVEPFIKIFHPSQLQKFLTEKDIGSSNAVYAAVGALGACLSRRDWLMIPFFLNGLLLCIFKDSFLALHHVFSLMGGFWISQIYFKVRIKYRAQTK
jgi:hypothetical protein